MEYLLCCFSGKQVERFQARLTVIIVRLCNKNGLEELDQSNGKMHSTPLQISGRLCNQNLLEELGQFNGKMHSHFKHPSSNMVQLTTQQRVVVVTEFHETKSLQLLKTLLGKLFPTGIRHLSRPSGQM